MPVKKSEIVSSQPQLELKTTKKLSEVSAQTDPVYLWSLLIEMHERLQDATELLKAHQKGARISDDTLDKFFEKTVENYKKPEKATPTKDKDGKNRNDDVYANEFIDFFAKMYKESGWNSTPF